MSGAVADAYPARRRSRSGRSLLAGPRLARVIRFPAVVVAISRQIATTTTGKLSYGTARRRAAKAAAAAPGSSASVIARTTTARRAPRAITSSRRSRRLDAADREPRPAVLVCGGVADQVEPGRGTAGLGRRRPGRAGAVVRDALLVPRGVTLPGVVRRPADQDVRPDDLARDTDGQVVLTEMQHRRAGRPRDVRAVVDRPERAVPLGRRGEDLEQPQFLARLECPSRAAGSRPPHARARRPGSR